MEEIRRFSVLNPERDSRYQKLERIVYDNGVEIIETPDQITVPYSVNDKYYLVQAGEEGRLDLISNKHYGSPLYWWVIAFASNVYDPLSVHVNDKLRIPAISTVMGLEGVYR